MNTVQWTALAVIALSFAGSIVVNAWRHGEKEVSKFNVWNALIAKAMWAFLIAMLVWG